MSGDAHLIRKSPLVEIRDPQPHWDQFVDLFTGEEGEVTVEGYNAVKEIAEELQQKLMHEFRQGREVELESYNAREVYNEIYLVLSEEGPFSYVYLAAMKEDLFKEVHHQVLETGKWPYDVKRLLTLDTRYAWARRMLNDFIERGSVPRKWKHTSEEEKEALRSSDLTLGGYYGDSYLEKAETIINRFPEISNFDEFKSTALVVKDDLGLSTHEDPGGAIVRTLRRRIKSKFGSPAWRHGFSGFKERVQELSSE